MRRRIRAMAKPAAAEEDPPPEPSPPEPDEPLPQMEVFQANTCKSLRHMIANSKWCFITANSNTHD